MSVNLGKILKNMGKFGKSWKIWENLGNLGLQNIFFIVLPLAMCLENILVRVTIILCV
jgi:hypothetical protein